MVSTAKLSTLKLVPKFKTIRSLKLLLVDMKANSSILMRLEMAGMAQNKPKYLIFIVVPPVIVENQISSISSLLKKTINLYEVNTKILNK